MKKHFDEMTQQDWEDLKGLFKCNSAKYDEYMARIENGFKRERSKFMKGRKKRTWATPMSEVQAVYLKKHPCSKFA